jgi:DNA-binding Lrp family transcriptional regulator
MRTARTTDKDAELIALLRADAREPTASLARKLGLSRTTVQDRLTRLEQEGIIAGYTVRLGAAPEAQALRAYLGVSVEPKRLTETTSILRKLPEIETLMAVSGKFDLMALVKVANAEALDRLLDRLGELPGVENTETSIVLSVKLDRR